MIKEDLVYFLKNGKLKNIDFGITRERLKELIGEPDSVLPEKSRYPTFFEYDNLEFYFEDKEANARLYFIQIDFPTKFAKEGKLIFEGYDWTTSLTIEKSISFLNKHKIRFEEKLNPNNLDLWRLLETESGVKIHFTNQKNEIVWELHSFGRSVEMKPTKPLTKQISFETEEKFYHQMRKKSQETKISIANICREIIENHLKNINL